MVEEHFADLTVFFKAFYTSWQDHKRSAALKRQLAAAWRKYQKAHPFKPQPIIGSSHPLHKACTRARTKAKRKVRFHLIHQLSSSYFLYKLKIRKASYLDNYSKDNPPPPLKVREEHTERLKQGFIKVVQKEKEFEKQLQVDTLVQSSSSFNTLFFFLVLRGLSDSLFSQTSPRFNYTSDDHPSSCNYLLGSAAERRTADAAEATRTAASAATPPGGSCC